jgi:hypothetical protein
MKRMVPTVVNGVGEVHAANVLHHHQSTHCTYIDKSGSLGHRHEFLREEANAPVSRDATRAMSAYLTSVPFPLHTPLYSRLYVFERERPLVFQKASKVRTVVHDGRVEQGGAEATLGHGLQCPHLTHRTSQALGLPHRDTRISECKNRDNREKHVSEHKGPTKKGTRPSDIQGRV